MKFNKIVIFVTKSRNIPGLPTNNVGFNHEELVGFKHNFNYITYYSGGCRYKALLTREDGDKKTIIYFDRFAQNQS
jgi:phage/plasmid primase-like uncharacterized protein